MTALNSSQQTAVLATNGPLLVLAGAGSGKTRVLISRISHLLDSGVEPGRILAITFTKKAAEEMSHRLAAQVGTSIARFATITTFHALGAEMLREFVAHSGLRPRFTIADEVEGRDRARSVLRQQGLPLNVTGERPRELQDRIARAKILLADTMVREGMTGDGLMDILARGDRRVWAKGGGELGFPDLDRFCEQYRLYQEQLLAQNIVEYEDLLVRPLLMCLERPETLQAWRSRWDYILVDEYQDTDHVQDHILRLLSEEHRNLCAVGDQNQAIYSWRGAKIENIRTFAERYAPCQVVALAENYRSTPEILDAANGALQSRGGGSALLGNLKSSRASGDLVRVWQSTTSDIESAILVRDVQAALKEGHIDRWGDVLVLYRLNSVARNIEVALKRAGVPYRITSGHALHERHDARILLAYMRLAENPYDMAAFEVAITNPARGIGGATLEKLKAAAKSRVVPILNIVDVPDAGVNLRPGARAELVKLKDLVLELDKDCSEHTVAYGLQRLVENLEIKQRLVMALAVAEEADDDEAADEAERKIADLDDFMLYVEEFVARRTNGANIVEVFLDDVLVRGSGDEIIAGIAQEGEDKITLMSVHAAKGLEAKRVYVIGLEETVFPIDCGKGEAEAEMLGEEARLFYVALTRAREHLVLSSARTRELRRGDGRPMMASRFLSDLPETAYRFEIYATDTTALGGG